MARYRKQTDLSSSLSSSSLCGLQTRRLSLALQWAQTWSDLNKPPLRIQVMFSASHSAVLFPNTWLQATTGYQLSSQTGSFVRWRQLHVLQQLFWQHRCFMHWRSSRPCYHQYDIIKGSWLHGGPSIWMKKISKYVKYICSRGDVFQ